MNDIPLRKHKIPPSRNKALHMIVIFLIIGVIAVSIVSYFNKADLLPFDIISKAFDTKNDNDIIAVDTLFINELMADNDVTIAGPDMNYPDWIELYNAGNESLTISMMYLTDDLSDPMKWQFPNGTTINPGEYLLIWADNIPDQEGLHAAFNLNANGDTVALFANDGTTLIDSVIFKKQIRDTSYGRIPDAGTDWEYISDPSPGYTNDGVITDNELPSWVLPLLIVFVILVIGAIIVIRRIIVRREFK